MPKFERTDEIDATVEKVWNVIIDPNHFPQWFPGIESVANIAKTDEGISFDFVRQGETGQGVITDIQPMRRLQVLTQLGKDKDSHVFELRPTGGFLGLSADECKVEYTLDTLIGGGILGNFIAGGNPEDAMKVKKTTKLLRKLVESL